MTQGDFSPGDIVSFRFGGVFRHYGVMTHRGTVITNSRSRGGVVEVPFAEFAEGNRLKRSRPSANADPLLVEARARRAIGSSYRLTAHNCIDLTRHTHKQRATPWQVCSATAMAVRDMFRKRR